MIIKKLTPEKKLKHYNTMLKILLKDKYTSLFVIVEDKAFDVTLENKEEVTLLIIKAIYKLKKELNIK